LEKLLEDSVLAGINRDYWKGGRMVEGKTLAQPSYACMVEWKTGIR
jgi:hypothetical protein